MRRRRAASEPPWEARALERCARARRSCRRGCRRTPRPARRCSRSSSARRRWSRRCRSTRHFSTCAACEHISGSPTQIAARLRAEVRDEVGLPITVGLACTKFLAKVASGVAKPDGMLVIPVGSELSFLHPLPVERLWGVGRVTSAKLRGHRITTVREVAAARRARRSSRCSAGRPGASCSRWRTTAIHGGSAEDHGAVRSALSARSGRRARAPAELAGDADDARSTGSRAGCVRRGARAGRSFCGCGSTTSRGRRARTRWPRRPPGRRRC